MVSSLSYSQFEPLFGSMHACSTALAELRRRDKDRRDKKSVDDLRLAVSRGEEFLKMAKRGFESSEISKEQIRSGILLIGVSIEMIREITRNKAKVLSKVSARWRTSLQTTLEQLEAQVEPMEDVAETWAIALDDKLVARIKTALLRLDLPKPVGSIPDWREGLESVSH